MLQAEVHNQLAPAELQQGLPQGVPPQGVPQQGIPLQGMPQQGVLQQNTYIPPGTAGQPPPTQMYYQQPPQGVGAPVQPLQPGTPQQFAPQMVPAQVVQLGVNLAVFLKLGPLEVGPSFKGFRGIIRRLCRVVP